MTIIVDTQEEKEALLAESKACHDAPQAPTWDYNTLAHIYLNPDMIEVKEDEDFDPFCAMC